MKTWGELKTAVLQALEREKDTQAATLLPTWKVLAEGEIFNRLRAGWMIRRGDAVYSSPLEGLPPSLCQIISVGLLDAQLTDEQVAAARTGAAALPGAIVRTLSPLGPEQQDPRFFYDGVPDSYMIEGHGIRLLPWPGRPVGVRLSYFSKGRDLVEDADSNETLTHLPGAYYYGMLRHAASFYGDDDLASRATTQLVAAVDQANGEAYGWMGTGMVARRAR